MRYLTVAALVLSGLSAGAVLAQTRGIAAECKLLEVAYKQTKASGAKTFPDILAGCPGYEAWPEQMTRRDDARAMRKAIATRVPDHAKAAGKAGKILFQRMIARGVPPEVAVSASKSKQFQNAIAAFGK